MALPSSRSAWSALTRHSSRGLHHPPPPVPSLPHLRILQQPTRRTFKIMREPSGLQEKNDLLNEPVSDQDIEKGKPRWSYTPPALIAPYGFQLKEAKDPRNSVWEVNSDPAKLNDFYERFLGRNGAYMLPEELRWLAVTHKSFDYGRRGFNTKLAYFGRQIIILETMNDIMTQPGNVHPYYNDPWMRDAFRSAALENVDKLSLQRPADYLKVDDLARLGFQLGLDRVMRWKPRDTRDLGLSGLHTVVTTTLLAIVGAVSLQHGGLVASQLARKKILHKIRRDVYEE